MFLFQNICLRKYIEKRAAAKEIEESERVDEPAADRRDGLTKRLSARFGKSRDQATEETADSKDVTDEKTDTRRGFFAKRRQNETRRTPSRQTSQVEAIEEADEQRPAFESALHGQTTSSKKLQPKAVAIPYSRLKKERFYDWPPDPTVSRATPIILYPRTADDSLTASVPSFIIDNDEPMESARQQESSDLVPADIPEFISFPSTFA